MLPLPDAAVLLVGRHRSFQGDEQTADRVRGALSAVLYLAYRLSLVGAPLRLARRVDAGSADGGAGALRRRPTRQPDAPLVPAPNAGLSCLSAGGLRDGQARVSGGSGPPAEWFRRTHVLCWVPWPGAGDARQTRRGDCYLAPAGRHVGLLARKDVAGWAHRYLPGTRCHGPR